MFLWKTKEKMEVIPIGKHANLNVCKDFGDVSILAYMGKQIRCN